LVTRKTPYAPLNAALRVSWRSKSADFLGEFAMLAWIASQSAYLEIVRWLAGRRSAHGIETSRRPRKPPKIAGFSLIKTHLSRKFGSNARQTNALRFQQMIAWFLHLADIHQMADGSGPNMADFAGRFVESV